MESDDIRWQQRFDNYRKALARLREAVGIVPQACFGGDPVHNDLVKKGLIQRFEFTHELAWKVMNDYAQYQGYTDVRGARDAFRLSLQMGIIEDTEWIDTIAARNITSHTYDEDTADVICRAIVDVYFPLFVKFEQTMLSIAAK